MKKLDGKYDLYWFIYVYICLWHQMLPPHGFLLRWRTVGEHWTNCTTAISMFPLAPKVQKSSWKSKFRSTSSPQITRSEAQYLLQISLSKLPNISQQNGNIYIYILTLFNISEAFWTYLTHFSILSQHISTLRSLSFHLDEPKRLKAFFAEVVASL